MGKAKFKWYTSSDSTKYLMHHIVKKVKHWQCSYSSFEEILWEEIHLTLARPVTNIIGYNTCQGTTSIRFPDSCAEQINTAN